MLTTTTPYFGEGSDLVDYGEDEPGGDLLKDDDGFTVNLADDDDCLSQEDEVGDEQPATGTGDNSSEGQPPTSKQVSTREIRHENVVNPVSQPVSTQQAIIEIIKRQPHAVMQKVGWEQKKQTYKELLSPL